MCAKLAVKSSDTSATQNMLQRNAGWPPRPEERVRSAVDRAPAVFEPSWRASALAEAAARPSASDANRRHPRICQHVDDAQAVPHLLSALEDQDALGALLCRALARPPGSGEAVDALEQRARTNAAQQVRIVAVEALGGSAANGALGAIGAIRRHRRPRVSRSRRDQRAGRDRHPDALSALLKICVTRFGPAGRGCRGAAKQHGAAAVARCSGWRPRRRSPAGASGCHRPRADGDTNAIGALIELLSDPVAPGSDCRRACTAWRAADRPDWTRPGAPTGRRTLGGCGALERMKHHAHPNISARHWMIPKPAVRLAAATALGRLGSQVAHRLHPDTLAQSDPDAVVRQAAQLALQAVDHTLCNSTPIRLAYLQAPLRSCVI